MKRLFYHGVCDWIEIAIEQMESIAKEGIFSRERLGEDYNHVCLYKKNEEYDYSTPDAIILNSARGGWIDNCCGFIVSNSVVAHKQSDRRKTDLVDEWRSEGAISIDKIIGVFFPLENRDLIAKPEDIEQVVLSSGMEEYLDENDYAQTVERLHRLVEIIKQRNWIVANSDVKDFTDRIDEMTQILDSRDSMVEER